MASSRPSATRVAAAKRALEDAAAEYRAARIAMRDRSLPSPTNTPHVCALDKLHFRAHVIATIERSREHAFVISLETVRSAGRCLAIRETNPRAPWHEEPETRRTVFFPIEQLPDIADAISEAMRASMHLHEREAPAQSATEAA